MSLFHCLIRYKANPPKKAQSYSHPADADLFYTLCQTLNRPDKLHCIFDTISDEPSGDKREHILTARIFDAPNPKVNRQVRIHSEFLPAANIEILYCEWPREGLRIDKIKFVKVNSKEILDELLVDITEQFTHCQSGGRPRIRKPLGPPISEEEQKSGFLAATDQKLFTPDPPNLLAKATLDDAEPAWGDTRLLSDDIGSNIARGRSFFGSDDERVPIRKALDSKSENWRTIPNDPDGINKTSLRFKYRRSLAFEVTIAPYLLVIRLQPLGPRTKRTLNPRKYLRHTTFSKFRFASDSYFGTSNAADVILALTSKQMNRALTCPSCVFREQLVLDEGDKDAMQKAFAIAAKSPAKEFLTRLAATGYVVVSMHLDGKASQCVGVSYDSDLGCILTFDICEDKKGKLFSDIQFDIELTVAQLKTVPRYDVVYGEPTELSQIRIDISRLSVGNPEYSSHLAVPNIARITESRPEPGVLRLDVGGQWVFPTSGVCFFW